MDLNLYDASVTVKKALDIIKEFKRNHLTKVNVNLSDSVAAKDKFTRIELGNQFRICCFKGHTI